jgi:hypothetical protein
MEHEKLKEGKGGKVPNRKEKGSLGMSSRNKVGIG